MVQVSDVVPTWDMTHMGPNRPIYFVGSWHFYFHCYHGRLIVYAHIAQNTKASLNSIPLRDVVVVVVNFISNSQIQLQATVLDARASRVK